MSEVSSFVPAKPLDTAVLFLVFSRLDTTKQVFEAIRQAKPPRLYVAADGARVGKEGEAEKVQAVRDFIIQNIDWDCQVKTLFRDKNLGCKNAVSSAITWFFDNEEQGIILEDDCLPSQSFFWYCEELLNKYKDDIKTYLISGDSRATESIQMQEDYGFCKYPMIWGWASWSRAWQQYDVNIKDWPEEKKTVLASVGTRQATKRFWKAIFDKMYRKEIDTWDYQLCYLLLRNQGKCIVPKINLIKNIGFGNDATHTFDENSTSANREIYDIPLPLNHNYKYESEVKINQYYDTNEFTSPSIFQRAINKLTKALFGRSFTK